MWREVLSEFLQPVVVPCADVILSAAARRWFYRRRHELKLGGATASLDYVDYICGH